MRTVLVLLALYGAGPVAAAPVQVTPAEIAACRSDAFAYCLSSVITLNGPAIAACLIANKAKVSKPCRAVIVAHGY